MGVFSFIEFGKVSSRKSSDILIKLQCNPPKPMAITQLRTQNRYGWREWG
jgi:hypothetical protein